ncbi:thiamine phosphate synthase [Acidocella sp.]|uniref:thiamine phosphate synthase n=1 Tax=Acidocella sp. TaxID=50710 RepID=UPI00261803A9|nr:thiamine phosphate synthase [Acidocella sp.]
MDSRLVAWARVVKRRRLGMEATGTRKKSGPPPLWFFTDAHRTPDPLSIISRLPVGLCGVLFRHDSHPDRAGLAKAAARICRARRLTLIVAGDARLAKAVAGGLHLRGGAPARRFLRTHALCSASVHNERELSKARRAGVDLVFISPVFPTATHPGVPGLGGAGWRLLARQAGRMSPCALGGISGWRAQALGRRCVGVGAIEAFL